jgi:hypothetical protein
MRQMSSPFPIDVDTDDLRTDADRYWTAWHERLRALERGVATADRSASAQDWSAIPGAQDVRAAYEVLLHRVEKYYHSGSEVFEGVARALQQSADAYLRAERDSEVEIAVVEAEIEDLR